MSGSVWIWQIGTLTVTHRSGLKRVADEAGLASLEDEMGRMLLFRGEVRRRKLELLNQPTKLTRAMLDEMKEEVMRCKNWEAVIQGWREALEYGEEQAMEEERVEREAQVVAGDTLPLEGGLTGALTCPYCRVSCSSAWSLKRHRWGKVVCI